MPLKPTKIELLAYNVYFGDCFLLIFHYADSSQKSVLIDFGSTGKGKPEHGVEEVDETDELASESTGERLLRIAEDIKLKTNGKLDVVIATHRHKDHIYGFGLKVAGKIIVDCDPEVVIQPWTEDPADNRDLSKKVQLLNADDFKADPRKHFAETLNDMQTVADAIESETMHLGDGSKFSKTIDKNLMDQIVFAADDNKKIKNLAAVKNLQKMRNPHYVHFGYDKVDWNKILPGVKVHVLGPPRLEDYPKITSATNTSDEFWSLLALNKFFWGVLAATNEIQVAGSKSSKSVFAREKAVPENKRPANVRWFIRQLRGIRAQQLLGLVKFVDNALNNTSVILLFEVGNQKLLFPGDAQIENWQFLLDSAAKDPKLKKLLEDTTLYKVGHHGSRNATPKSLWKDFKKKSEKSSNKSRLKTVVSTMKGKHGESEDTKVPLPKMVTAMRAQSNFTTTEEFEDGFVEPVTIAIKH
jgi:ribonuclease BN (tRNA processing enzyme)